MAVGKKGSGDDPNPSDACISLFRLPTTPAATAAATAAAESSIGFFGLAHVTARLAANRLAEAARLEELLLARGEDKFLPAILAVHFFILRHCAYPLELDTITLLWTIGLLNGGSARDPRFCSFLLPIRLVRLGAHRPVAPNSRSQHHYTLLWLLSKAISMKWFQNSCRSVYTSCGKTKVGNKPFAASGPERHAILMRFSP